MLAAAAIALERSFPSALLYDYNRDNAFMIQLLAILGLANAAYLFWQHSQVSLGRKMFCLIGGDCQAVVESKYGKTLGVKNEIWGMAYYLLIIFLFLADVKILVAFFSFIAAASSLYLLYLQHFVLKKYCSWCLLAIGLNWLIFLLSV